MAMKGVRKVSFKKLKKIENCREVLRLVSVSELANTTGLTKMTILNRIRRRELEAVSFKNLTLVILKKPKEKEEVLQNA